MGATVSRGGLGNGPGTSCCGRGRGRGGGPGPEFGWLDREKGLRERGST